MQQAGIAHGLIVESEGTHKAVQPLVIDGYADRHGPSVFSDGGGEFIEELADSLPCLPETDD